jgi:hypothetical protein
MKVQIDTELRWKFLKIKVPSSLYKATSLLYILMKLHDNKYFFLEMSLQLWQKVEN